MTGPDAKPFACIYTTPRGLCPGGSGPSLEHFLPYGAGTFKG